MKIGIFIEKVNDMDKVITLLKGFGYKSSTGYVTAAATNIIINTETKEFDDRAMHIHPHMIDCMLPYEFFMREYWRFLSDKDEYYMQDLNILEEIQNDIKFIKQKLNTTIPDEISINSSGVVIKKYFKEV